MATIQNLYNYLPKYFLKGKVHINTTTKQIFFVLLGIAIIIAIFAEQLIAWFL